MNVSNKDKLESNTRFTWGDDFTDYPFDFPTITDAHINLTSEDSSLWQKVKIELHNYFSRKALMESGWLVPPTIYVSTRHQTPITFLNAPKKEQKEKTEDESKQKRVYKGKRLKRVQKVLRKTTTVEETIEEKQPVQAETTTETVETAVENVVDPQAEMNTVVEADNLEPNEIESKPIEKRQKRRSARPKSVKRHE
eukprot:TRINITY_DN1640_c0_g1_i1.p1 TRINITY_DN1640_c0_g1~~TRINITY_DN1640_c0_g1_i1.p1  ORF type:complete len:196 (+),score=57.74 TRINITY_DN1640_c0_g1_i1:29-616(+)